MAKPALLVNKPYVEIGGVKWATMNIGANSETDYGLYFQWGDTAGYTSGQCGANTTSYKKPFAWQDCALHNGTTASTAASFTKYNGNDDLTVLEQCDDAAAANWGGNWRMPTIGEIAALSAAVNTEWVTNYNGSGVNGRLMTDKTDSSKKLFFPAAGFCRDGSVRYAGSNSRYWSSSLYSLNALGAYDLYLVSSNVYWQDNYYRYVGMSVRPVLDMPTPKLDGYEYVDLGLPSGLKWATYNVGASSETDYGNYYQYGKGASTYQVTSGESDYRGTEKPLSLTYDTARQVMGGDWRMPTRTEFEELTANTKYTFTTINGVNGGKFTSKVNPNAYVFFPAAGFLSDGSLSYEGSYGLVWSSTPYDSSYAYNLHLRIRYNDIRYATRNDGLSVRGVHA